MTRGARRRGLGAAVSATVRPARALATWLLLAVGALGCLTAEGSLALDLADLTEEQVASLRQIEVWVIAASAPGGEGEIACADLVGGTVDIGDPQLIVRHQGSFSYPTERPGPVGHLPEGAALFFARGRDSRCRRVAEGCGAVTLRSGRDEAVTVDLAAVGPPLAEERLCGADTYCADGACTPCSGSVDRDADGHWIDECGGDDCDDMDPAVFPGARQQCGEAIDHDCDGLIDDEQGCEPCEADGLRWLGSSRTPALGAAMVGDVLYTVTAEMLEAYRVEGDEESVTLTRLGATRHPVGRPLRPLVVRDYLLVLGGDGVRSGVWAYSRRALEEAGGAGEELVDPIATALSADFAAPTAALAYRDKAYLSTMDDRLVSVDIGSLRTEWARLGTHQETGLGTTWSDCRNMTVVPGAEGDGRWLMGVTPFTRLMVSVPLTVGGPEPGVPVVRRSFVVGTLVGPTDVAPLGDRLAVAHGTTGLLLLGTEMAISGEQWSHEQESAFPHRRFAEPYCTEDEEPRCEQAVKVSVIGTSRALVLTTDGVIDGPSQVYLVNVSGTWPEILDWEPMSDPIRGSDLVVSGTRAYVAGVDDDGRGAVEVIGLECSGG